MLRLLSKRERDELESLLDLRDPKMTSPLKASVSRLHGFFCAVVSGPLIMPSEWMAVVFGNDDEAAWDSLEQAERAMGLLTRLHNEAADGLRGERRFAIVIDRIGDEPDSIDLANDWCRGYLTGTSVRKNEWSQAFDAPELQQSFEGILRLGYHEGAAPVDPFEEDELYDALLDSLPQAAVNIYEWWRQRLYAPPKPYRRASAKIGANDPCLCGSGKKYKRCCSPVR